jgi:hypothetical protein
MKINPYIYGIVVLVLFFGVIGIAKATDNWTVSGKISAATGATITATGTNPDEIKGWMTLADVSKAYNIPLSEMLAQFQLPADTPGTKQIKELESDTFETSALREWLKTKLGQ